VVSDGCVIGAGSRIERCMIGVRSYIGANCVLRDTVMLGADKFETDAQRAANRAAGRPSLNVGDGSEIANAILDKDCRIGRGVKLLNAAGVQEADGPGGSYHIRDGIICVPRGATIPDGAVV
jgi:glucose-1-phosphate adenylyltransferase